MYGNQTILLDWTVCLAFAGYVSTPRYCHPFSRYSFTFLGLFHCMVWSWILDWIHAHEADTRHEGS